METAQPCEKQLIIDALNKLESLSVSLEDYAIGVANGTMARKPGLTNEQQWQTLHPDHPHAYDGKKMNAADTIRNTGRSHPLEEFEPDVLNRIHLVLCDCCAAVRLSLATALFYGGDQSSMEPLQRLIDQEQRPDLLDTSKMVYRAARAAFGRCETRGKYYFTAGMSRVLIITDEIDLVSDLLDVTDAHGIHLYQSHSALDLIVLGELAAAIVDRNLCDADDWSAYRDFLTELDCEQRTPLILIDGIQVRFDLIDPLTTSPEEAAKVVLKQMLTVPEEKNICKPHGALSYIIKYQAEAICEKLASLLDAQQEGA